MDKVQVKVYMPRSLAEALHKEAEVSGDSKSRIVSDSTRKELKRRAKR